MYAVTCSVITTNTQMVTHTPAAANTYYSTNLEHLRLQRPGAGRTNSGLLSDVTWHPQPDLTVKLITPPGQECFFLTKCNVNLLPSQEQG